MKHIQVGSILYGYCGGAFGRDGYTDKRVEIVAVDYVAVRYMDSENKPDFYAGDPKDLEKYLIDPEEGL